MKEVYLPLAFWYYRIERRARVHNLIAKNLFQLHGSNNYTALAGEEEDNANLFPFSKEMLGRCLVLAKGEGNDMSQWVLKSNGDIIPGITCHPLKVEEMCSLTEVKKR